MSDSSYYCAACGLALERPSPTGLGGGCNEALTNEMPRRPASRSLLSRVQSWILISPLTEKQKSQWRRGGKSLTEVVSVLFGLLREASKLPRERKLSENYRLVASNILRELGCPNMATKVAKGAAVHWYVHSGPWLRLVLKPPKFTAQDRLLALPGAKNKPRGDGYSRLILIPDLFEDVMVSLMRMLYPCTWCRMPGGHFLYLEELSKEALERHHKAFGLTVLRAQRNPAGGWYRVYVPYKTELNRDLRAVKGVWWEKEIKAWKVLDESIEQVKALVAHYFNGKLSIVPSQ